MVRRMSPDGNRVVAPEAGRLLALGSLVPGVVHELNNALLGLLGMLELARGDASPAVGDRLAIAQQAGEEIRELARVLGALAREPLDERVAIDLRELAGEVVAAAGSVNLVRGLEVAEVYAPEPARVEASIAQARQALLLLLCAGFAASGREGPLLVEVGPLATGCSEAGAEQEQKRLPRLRNARLDARRLGRIHLRDLQAANQVDGTRRGDDLTGELAQVDRHALVERLARERPEHPRELADLLACLLRDREPVADRRRRVSPRQLEHPEQAEQGVVQLVHDAGDEAPQCEQAAGLGRHHAIPIGAHPPNHRPRSLDRGTACQKFCSGVTMKGSECLPLLL